MKKVELSYTQNPSSTYAPYSCEQIKKKFMKISLLVPEIKGHLVKKTKLSETVKIEKKVALFQ